MDLLIRTFPRKNLNSGVSEAKGNIYIEKHVGQVSSVVFSATSAMRLKVYNRRKSMQRCARKERPYSGGLGRDISRCDLRTMASTNIKRDRDPAVRVSADILFSKSALAAVA